MPRTLRSKVTLFTLVIFLFGIWSLAFVASNILREDLRQLLTAQQFSTASFVATDVDRDLSDRLKALELIGQSITPEMLSNPASMELMLAHRPTLLTLFNAGGLVYQMDGTAIADTRRDAGRVGVNYNNSETVATALRLGKSNVGRPAMGRKLDAPVFAITVPLRTGDGRVIGAMSGVTNLGQPNFLDKLTGHRYCKTGGYILVAPAQQLITPAFGAA